MQNKILASRSVIVDKIIQRFQQTTFNIHKEKINIISQRKVSDPAPQQVHYLSQMQKSKQAVNKISSVFDPIKVQNRAMMKHINEIVHRRSHSMTHLKLHKNHRVESQKKQIQKQNKMLGFKIAEEKLKFLDVKKSLKKQFAEYEYNRQRLRKVKDSQQKQKKSSSKTHFKQAKAKADVRQIKSKGKSKNKSKNRSAEKIRLNLQF